jgi:hypothetical protein
MVTQTDEQSDELLRIIRMTRFRSAAIKSGTRCTKHAFLHYNRPAYDVLH